MLTLLVMLIGGIVLATVAGARRTQTAYGRFLARSSPADVVISPGSVPDGFYGELARLPEVTAIAVIAAYPLVRVLPSGQVDFSASTPWAIDEPYFYGIDRPNLRQGRLPRPDRADEVLVTQRLADQLHLGAGAHLTLRDLSDAHLDDIPIQVAPDEGTPVTFVVVGVGVLPLGVVSPTRESDAQSDANVYLSPAYYRDHGGTAGAFYAGASLRLRPGTDTASLRSKIDALAGSGVEFSEEALRRAAVTGAIRPQWGALAVFALLAGTAGLLLAGQALSRDITGGAAELPTMSALGMTRSAMAFAGLLPATGIAVGGAIGAAALAAATSGWFPVGAARLAEPHPGLTLNLAVLGGGAATMVALLVGWTAVPVWRSVRSATALHVPSRSETRRSRLAQRAVRAGLPPSATVGVQMALEPGRGRTAVPVRSAMTGAAVAIAAVVAAVTFGANLDRLVQTPTRYGWNWDLAVDAGFRQVTGQTALTIASSVPSVAEMAGGTYGTLAVGGRSVPAIGVDGLRGEVFPTLLDGRAPESSDEIVLGAVTLRATGKAIGQTVDVGDGDKRRPMRVVGRAVFPAFGRGSFSSTGLGVGAAVTTEALATTTAGPGSYNFVLFRYRSGADATSTSALLTAAFDSAGCPVGQCGFFRTRRPAQVNDYARVRGTPVALAALLAVLGAAAVAHAVVTSVRRRRTDLAVLKSLGFVGRQVSATIAWQATTLAVVAVAVGLPLGLVAGRQLWVLFARQLGIATGAANPWFTLALIPVLSLALVNLVAIPPALAAARVRPAAALRAE